MLDEACIAVQFSAPGVRDVHNVLFGCLSVVELYRLSVTCRSWYDATKGQLLKLKEYAIEVNAVDMYDRSLMAKLHKASDVGDLIGVKVLINTFRPNYRQRIEIVDSLVNYANDTTVMDFLYGFAPRNDDMLYQFWKPVLERCIMENIESVFEFIFRNELLGLLGKQRNDLWRCAFRTAVIAKSGNYFDRLVELLDMHRVKLRARVCPRHVGHANCKYCDGDPTLEKNPENVLYELRNIYLECYTIAKEHAPTFVDRCLKLIGGVVPEFNDDIVAIHGEIGVIPFHRMTHDQLILFLSHAITAGHWRLVEFAASTDLGFTTGLSDRDWEFLNSINFSIDDWNSLVLTAARAGKIDIVHRLLDVVDIRVEEVLVTLVSAPCTLNHANAYLIVRRLAQDATPILDIAFKRAIENPRLYDWSLALARCKPDLTIIDGIDDEHIRDELLAYHQRGDSLLKCKLTRDSIHYCCSSYRHLDFD